MDLYHLFLFIYIILMLITFVIVVGITKKRIGGKPAGARTKRTAFIASLPILWISSSFFFIIIPESIDWFWHISFLETYPLKPIAVLEMIGAYFLSIDGVISMGASFRMGIPRNEKTPLITTGIFQYIRNPSFLALDIAVLGTMVIIPNGLTLFITGLVIVVYHWQILEEERHLTQLHGAEYLAYKQRTGRYLPKILK